MKFSNGCWLDKPGYQIYSPKEVYNYKIEGDILTIYAPCNNINQRGDTLKGPVITYKISSPMENVIRVRAYHFMGKQKKAPSFEIFEDEHNNFVIEDNEKEIIFKSGNVKAVINKEVFEINFYKGDKKLTSSKPRGLAYVNTEEERVFMKVPEDGVFMKEELHLSVGELVYGLGEKFTPLVKNGQSIDIWNEDGGTSTEQSYKSIPFYMTNKGYGVFVNHPEKVSFEVGSEKVTKVQFSVPGECLDYFIIGGESMKEVVENYTTLTGKPALPPAWSFGLWLTTSFTTNYDEETVNSFVDGMADRDLPLRVFHFDCFWMKDFNWCNFEWDSRVFPDPKGMLTRLKKKGLKICVWINPYIAQESKLFDEGMEHGYLIKKPNGDVWQWDLWQPAMGIVDFTNPDACKWYSSKLKELIDMGVDCFKTDFGERIPTEVAYFDGSDPYKMHNYYTQIYNKVVFETLKENLGEDEAAVFARSATVGGQQFPVHWGGDCEANYESMAESLRGGLSLCMSGFGFWSHDIGGFESTATADVYKRWVAFGLLSSHSRLHGSSSYRVPWLYDEEACDVVRFFTKLKCSIMPYLYNAANDAALIGTPVMRAMILEFQNDLACNYLDKQYMLGDSILVAPIFNEEGEANYYLPEGTWTNFISGKKYEGGRWIKEIHDYSSVPMMVKENSLIAVGCESSKPDYHYREDISIFAYELKEDKEAKTTIIDMKGKITLDVGVLKKGNAITIKSTGTEGNWSLVLKNISNIEKVDGGEIVTEGEDTKIIFNSGNCMAICYSK
ncbi:alpha-xylosidase [Clostridium chromiireducens]|uniref:alpha-D-xyloside xylohydrolase n=1 Tax=Clostridium chromiireducens TaxID=225345 RepID=A0A1V4ITP1_9CLOT|nr:alpha-xylosidase [Clostridium chromiireducens]OPJ63165.1 alpha-xylosidase [Clostridium chromiireducens]RII34648.1 alpha-xylosidase [Clostridium chromiireducens]